MLVPDERLVQAQPIAHEAYREGASVIYVHARNPEQQAREMLGISQTPSKY